MTALVMDLGGTRLKAGIVSGGVIRRTSVEDVAGQVLETIEKTGRVLLAEAGSVDAVGLCVPGLVENGMLVSLPGKHAGLEGTDLDAFLRKAFDAARTVVTNDAVAYATGEAVAGAGRGCRRAVVVTIGTGVGVTVIEDGRPATGGALGAGILGGFIPIAEDSPETDTNGTRGTIEALCAAQRIAEACESGYASPAEVYAAHARGEEAARRGIETYRRRLACALVALAHAHAPDRLIVGGGPMTPDNPIVPGLEEMVNANLFGTYRVEVRTATLGDTASLAGLAHLLEAPQ